MSLGMFVLVSVLLSYLRPFGVPVVLKLTCLVGLALLCGGAIGLVARRFSEAVFWSVIGSILGYLTVVNAPFSHWTGEYVWPMLGGIVGAVAAVLSGKKARYRVAHCSLLGLGLVSLHELALLRFTRDSVDALVCVLWEVPCWRSSWNWQAVSRNGHRSHGILSRLDSSSLESRSTGSPCGTFLGYNPLDSGVQAEALGGRHRMNAGASCNLRSGTSDQLWIEKQHPRPSPPAGFAPPARSSCSPEPAFPPKVMSPRSATRKVSGSAFPSRSSLPGGGSSGRHPPAATVGRVHRRRAAPDRRCGAQPRP